MNQLHVITVGDEFYLRVVTPVTPLPQGAHSVLHVNWDGEVEQLMSAMRRLRVSANDAGLGKIINLP